MYFGISSELITCIFTIRETPDQVTQFLYGIDHDELFICIQSYTLMVILPFKRDKQIVLQLLINCYSRFISTETFLAYIVINVENDKISFKRW